jgi:hypothetical protein
MSIAMWNGGETYPNLGTFWDYRWTGSVTRQSAPWDPRPPCLNVSLRGLTVSETVGHPARPDHS